MIAAENAVRRLTLVDHEPKMLEVLEHAALSWDFECQTADTAEAALEMLVRCPSPVVVTAVRMPGRGGAWLVREIQARWPQTLTIVVTAPHDDEALTECLHAGAHSFFLRPIALPEFRNALRYAYTSYQLQRERERDRRRLERELARRTRAQRVTYLSAIDSLVRTLEARDPQTCGHSRRVRRYAGALAKAMDLPVKTRAQVKLAAQMHDIGKVGLAEGILHKTTPLTADEVAVIREHPVVGERILSPIVRSRVVLDGIRHHHERWDGAGYPDGLAGDAIPLVARIIALADCFDALTTLRAYRRALDPAAALRRIEYEAGSHFDPTLVPLFCAATRAPR